MNEKVLKKRAWIKNAIIIFLAVMLLLTFFSNTILNYSLPEVAAQYPASGTVTSKIRASGTVEANENYEVVLSESRTIKSVSVKNGDTVKKGDVLCIIEAMKLMNEITAEQSGTIVELCVGNGQVVEYGHPLFRIRP